MDREQCTICCAEAAFCCPECNFASYCSIECATTDETLHLLLCAPYRTFLATPRPSKTHQVGLLIPTTGTPKFFWATWEANPNQTSANVEPELNHVFGEGMAQVQRFTISLDAYRNFDSGHDLNIFTSMARDRAPSSFIDQLQAGKRSPKKWTGPIVVLAAERGDTPDKAPAPQDINLEDVRVVVDYLVYGDKPLEDQHASVWNRYGRASQVLGVKIRCAAEMDESGEKFTVVKVPKDHPVFDSKPSPISVAMRIPLKMWIYPHAEVDTGLGFINEEAISLNRIIDTTAMEWGDVPERWKGGIGSVLVVRRDGKDLKAGEVKAVAAFCTDALDILISQCQRGVGYSRDCLVREFMERSTFELWLANRMTRMEREGVDEGLLSPYEGSGFEITPDEDVEMGGVVSPGESSQAIGGLQATQGDTVRPRKPRVRLFITPSDRVLRR